jgi:hypothetical protein
VKAEVNRLQNSVTLQLQEWRNNQWSDTLEALHPEDQSLCRITPTPPLVTRGGISLLGSENAEALADSLEAQFQPVTDPSDSAVIETVDVALRAYCYATASEPMLTNPVEVQDAIGVSKSSRHHALTVSRKGPSSIFPSE